MLQPLGSSDQVSSFAGEKDRLPRSTVLVRVKVDMYCTHQVESHVVPDGEHEIEVLKRELPKIRELMVWDNDEPRRIDEAKREYQNRCDNAFADHMQGQGNRVARDTVKAARRAQEAIDEWVAAGRKGDEPPQLDRQQADLVEKRTEFEDKLGAISWQGIFYEKFDRGVMPIRSIKVVDDNIPLPDEVERREFDAEAAKAITSAVLKGQAATAPGLTLDDVQKMLADQEKRLRAELSGGKAKG